MCKAAAAAIKEKWSVYGSDRLYIERRFTQKHQLLTDVSKVLRGAVDEVDRLTRQAAASETRATLTKAAARWAVHAVARSPASDVSERVALLVGDDDARVSLSVTFVLASPLLSACEWRTRGADSADPLKLRAPDGAGWWWNAETLSMAERTLMDADTDWLRVVPPAKYADGTQEVLPVVRLWKLLFAFFPGDKARPNELVEALEPLVRAWLDQQPAIWPTHCCTKSQTAVREDVLAYDAPLGLALALLSADESPAVRRAAARLVTSVVPMLLERGYGRGLRTVACAQQCCTVMATMEVTRLGELLRTAPVSPLGLLRLAAAASGADGQREEPAEQSAARAAWADAAALLASRSA